MSEMGIEKAVLGIRYLIKYANKLIKLIFLLFQIVLAKLNFGVY